MLSRLLRPAGSSLSCAMASKAVIFSSTSNAKSFHVLCSSGDSVMKNDRPKRRTGDEINEVITKTGTGKSSSSSSSSSASSSSSSSSSDGGDPPPPPTNQAASFPFSNITEQQFQQWSDEIRELELPVQAFFARHRPLLVMDPDEGKNLASRQFSDDSRVVPVWTPRTNLFELQQSTGGHYGESGSNVSSLIPAKIAKELGPFHVEHVEDPLTRSLSSMSLTSKGVSINKSKFLTSTPNKVTGCTVLNLKDGDKENPETTTVIFARTTNDESPLQTVISFLNNNAPESYTSTEISASSLANFGLSGGILDLNDGEFSSDISATSVKRKRKLKMNRHKYKKRMKAQRSLRKRLGK